MISMPYLDVILTATESKVGYSLITSEHCVISIYQLCIITQMWYGCICTDATSDCKKTF